MHESFCCRALGALYGKFVSCGGMTYSVFIKLYESTVEPILFYGSGIWGTKQYSVINNGSFNSSGAISAMSSAYSRILKKISSILISHWRSLIRCAIGIVYG
jgi:hypothetical protein